MLLRIEYHEYLRKCGQYTKAWMNLEVWLNDLDDHTISDIQKDIGQFDQHVRSLLSIQ